MLTDLSAYIDGTAGRAVAVTSVIAGQVLFAASDGLRPASSLLPSQAVVVAGVAEGSASAGDELVVVMDGLWRGTTPWPVGAPLFLGADTYPTTDPDSGHVCLPIGHVRAPGVIQVRFGLPIVTGGA